MKNLYKYFLLALVISVVSSCKKDDYTKLSHKVPTKLVYADASYTLTDMLTDKSIEVSETDGQESDYYRFLVDSIYTIQRNIITGEDEVVMLLTDNKDVKNSEYVIDEETGVITLIGGTAKVPGSYTTDAAVQNAAGLTTFEGAWKFNIAPEKDLYVRYFPNKLDLTVKDLKNKNSSTKVRGIYQKEGLDKDIKLSDLENPYSVYMVTKVIGGVEEDDAALAKKFSIDMNGIISISKGDAKKLDVGDYYVSINVATDHGDIKMEKVWKLGILAPYIAYTPEVLEIRRSDGHEHHSKPKIHGTFAVKKNSWKITQITDENGEDLTGDDKVKAITIDKAKGIVYVDLGKADLAAGTYKLAIQVENKDVAGEYIKTVFTIHKQF